MQSENGKPEPLVFVGGGSLLSQAVGYAINAGIAVAHVCCPVGDSALPRLRKLGVEVLESDDPSNDLLPLVSGRGGTKVFSINNRYILTDRLLSCGPTFFNVHNGLVQRYRGIAEVCVFAAICNAEPRYGATLHQLLPGQKVDTGPVVAQIDFNIDMDHDNFASLMTRSLRACQQLFEDNVRSIASGEYTTSPVSLSGPAYSYKNMQSIRDTANIGRLEKASDLGGYRSFFPRLA